jgi:3-hydroxyacyl-[acyl-carrier-protein] dehydratase
MNLPDQPIYDASVIQEILPHRRPFLFVDRIVKFEMGKKIIAEKHVSPKEFFFAGHFPGKPIMPGVLVSEALAQTSGLLLGLTWKEKTNSKNQKDACLFFLANLNMKFLAPAKPGETLRMEASLEKNYGGLFFFEVAAYVLGNRIAKGTLTLAKGNE